MDLQLTRYVRINEINPSILSNIHNKAGKKKNASTFSLK
jgi:hypothetical protein